MKRIKSFLPFLLVSSFVWLVACQPDEPLQSNREVEVSVSFAGFTISSEEPDGPLYAPAASDKTASQASVNRIGLAVFDANNSLVHFVQQDQDDDPSVFGQGFSFRLHVGTYTFVSVAYKLPSITATKPILTIVSPTLVSLGDMIPSNYTYTNVQSVTIAGNTSQSLIIDFGRRKNASFTIKISDETPDEVETLRITSDPSAEVAPELTINPTTGFCSTKYKHVFTRSKTENNIISFTNGQYGIGVFLTQSPDVHDFLIEALDINGNVLYSRAINGISLSPSDFVTASGTFFSPTADFSFIFDNSVTNINISLD